MCQYRHYQFDTLRRAKHSSMMILYHLHNPTLYNLKPLCIICNKQIQDVRWHCSDGCVNSDTCHQCYSSNNIECQHADTSHKLTPYRVSFT